jgi:spermidine/putrescine-binding protein
MRKRAPLKMIASAIAASAAMALTACGGPSSGGSTEDKTLNVLSWETYHDKAQLDAFTQKTGIKVNIVNVGSPDEMFAKVKSAPSQWDLALVTSGWYDNYTKANLLEPIDTTKVTALNDMKLGPAVKTANFMGSCTTGATSPSHGPTTPHLQLLN